MHLQGWSLIQVDANISHPFYENITLHYMYITLKIFKRVLCENCKDHEKN